MYFVLFFTFFITNKIKCYYIFHDSNLDEISNNIAMLVKPIKKISGIFPNHEFELQFDLEAEDTDEPRPTKYKPSNAIMRSKSVLPGQSTTTTANDEDYVPSSIETAPDPDNPIVYMKDLKNALEEYDKKHANGSCIKEEPTTELPNLLSSLSDNPALSDVLQLIKRGAKLQNEKPKTGDSDLSWIKIKVPAA